MRAEQRCGWLPASTWPEVPSLPKYLIDGEPKYPPVCPGWLERQPLVVDVAHAWASFEKGCLGDVFPDPPNVLVEGLFLMSAAVNRSEAERNARRGAEQPPIPPSP